MGEGWAEKHPFRTGVSAPGPPVSFIVFPARGWRGDKGAVCERLLRGGRTSFPSGLISALLICLVLESGGPNLRQTPHLVLPLLSLSIQAYLSLPRAAPPPLSLSYLAAFPSVPLS